MIKKLMFLILVLGIASAANAVDVVDIVISGVGGVQETVDPWSVITDPITPTQNIEVFPSQWVSLDIVYTDDGTGTGLISLAMDVVVTGPATLYLGELGPASGNTLLTFPTGAWDLIYAPPSQPPISFIGPFDDGTYATPASIDLSMNNGLMGEQGVPVVALDHLLLHCDGPGLVTVTLVNNPLAVAGGTYNMAAVAPGFGNGVTITQIVPEPMTLSLLSLGGLLLKRKRTA